MNLLIIADDETIDRKIGEAHADVLISCGDIPDDIIHRVATTIGTSQILAVKGNHDSSGVFRNPIVDLHLQLKTIEGIRFGGFAGAWRYKPRGNYLFEQEQATELLVDFPAVDVFVAHNSPRHIHDRDDDVHLGFDAFADYIARVQPRLFIHGHQHVNRETQIGRTKVLGVYGFKKISVDTL